MTLRPTTRHRRRDPVNELYDSACALLDAAHELRAAAKRAGSAPALAATFGCLEACFGALTTSIGDMRARAVEHVTAGRADDSAAVESVSATLDALAQELDEAGGAAGVARTIAASWIAADGVE